MRQDLRSIPFFGDLPDDVLNDIARQCRREHYRNGELIFAEGDFGDRMYVIQSGQVKVVSEQNGHEKIYSYLNPGNFFGETALLTGEPRNASVRVVIDSDLISLGKNDLERLVHRHPAIGVDISRELSRRLTRAQSPHVAREEFNLVAVVGSPTPELARQLAEISGEEVFLLDLGGLAGRTIDQASLAQAHVQFARGGEGLTAEELPTRLSALVQEYYWILIAIPLYPSLLTVKAIDLADVTVHFADRDDVWLTQVAARGYWRVGNSDRHIGRVARRIAQRQVGLALSSGGARGLAHIGVLKVFEEERIPLDMIGATSMGAIVGALYASGHSLQDIIQFAGMMQRQTNFLTGFSLWDVGLPPRSGLLRGQKTLEYFRRSLDNKNFEDLETPLRVVSTDVISGEEVVFEKGSLAEAVRASMSIIGVFEPAHVGDHFLVDGGAVNPVPTSLLADQGINLIIASNVIPSLQDRLNRKQQAANGRPPNVIGIVMSAMEIMESEIIKTRMQRVDVLIAPDVARFSTLDYDRVHAIIEVGEQAARFQLPHIRQLLAPRPRPRPI